jgi:hypothetical protein
MTRLTISQRLREFWARTLETFMGPFDWETELKGASTTYKGNFLVYDRRGRIVFRIMGYIVQWSNLPAQVYLYDPPDFVRNHPHAPCLQLLRPNDKWFKFHFDQPARDFPGAYTYVEYFLTTAYFIKN